VAYDKGIAERIREVFVGRLDVIEKKMFGGIAFMVRGNMCCGVISDTLMARVGPGNYVACLKRPYAREMNFTGRPMKSFVYVDQEGFEDDADLLAWVTLCEEFVTSLPTK
jgi:TfoX/Sxy family transcriptional regulator of competence genes